MNDVGFCGFRNRCDKPDWSEVVAASGMCAGGAGITVGSIVSSTPLTALSTFVCATHLVLAGRIRYLKPLSELGHAVNNLGTTAQILSQEERHTEQGLRNLELREREFQAKLEEVQAEKKALQEERTLNLMKISELTSLLEKVGESYGTFERTGVRIERMFSEEQGQVNLLASLQRQQVVEAGLLHETADDVKETVASLERDVEQLATEDRNMVRENNQFDCLIARLQIQLQKEREEKKALQELVDQIGTAESIQKSIEEGVCELEKIERRLEQLSSAIPAPKALPPASSKMQ